MRILNKYILKSFLVPFLATFLIILFVLVMQILWLQFDKIAGKGISIGYIFKFLGYVAQMQIPLALPIAILLSSIMALGTLSENYEFAAVKSAGISLQRFIRPLVILMFLLSGLNFLFLNYAFPRAAFKFKNMLLDMQKTQPALALIPGTFNTEIPGYSIKFAEKYGKEDNLLRDVHIYYDLNKATANVKVIKAKNGEITTEEGSKYMTLILKEGHHYEDLVDRRKSYKESQNMPFTKSYFDEYTVNIDISKLGNIDAKDYKEDREMLSLNQLSYYTDSLKPKYDEYIESKAKSIMTRVGLKKMINDSTDYSLFNKDILQNFDSITKVSVVEKAIMSSQNTLSDITGFKTVLKNKQKFLNVYNTEYHRRLAFSLACLVLFFIGAPLGSIIRKGGFGFPMVLAIMIFVIYFFISTLGRNMAHSSTITAALGGWLSSIILLPLGLFLMKRATKDKGIFNVDLFLQPTTNFFNKLFFKKSVEDKLIPALESANQPIVNISELDIRIKEKFQFLKSEQLIDVVKNYRQYNYTEVERQVAIELLQQQGISVEELKLSGNFENTSYIAASKNYKKLKRNTSYAMVLYLLSIILSIMIPYIENSLSISKTFVSILYILNTLYILNIIVAITFLIYLVKSFIAHGKVNKALNQKMELDVALIYFFVGIPLYILFYFYIMSSIKEKMKMIK